MQGSFKKGRALLCCPAGGHPPLFQSLSTRFPRKPDPTVSWPFRLCVLFKQSLSKSSTRILFFISLRSLSACLSSSASFCFLLNQRQGSVVWVTGRKCHHHWLLFIFKAPLASCSFCLLSTFQSLVFTEKLGFFLKEDCKLVGKRTK